MYIVDLALVKKSLKKVPYFIRDKVQIWADMVEKKGLLAVQKLGGYRDHVLRGNRKGQRSVYLNKKWRLIYTVSREGRVNIIIVKEVTPHDY